MPFRGSAAELTVALDSLDRLNLLPDDELILVDNANERLVVAPPEIRVVAAPKLASSYYARNAGAEAAVNDWVLFIDSDCIPPADLIDVFFEPAPAAGTAIVAGEVTGAAGQASLPARHATDRGHLGVEEHLTKGPWPAGVTANLLIKRDSMLALGGFCEVKSGSDLDLCWRAGQVGLGFEFRPHARVEHVHPERIRAMLRKARRYGPGQLWLGRRFPGYSSRPRPVHHAVRALGGAAFWGLKGQGRRALYKLLDGLWEVSYAAGYWAGSNRSVSPGPVPRSRSADGRLAVVVDAFPARSETFITAELDQLVELGLRPRVDSSLRPTWMDRQTAELWTPTYQEDDSPLEKLRALLWLSIRHPARTLADVRGRARWRVEEDAWPLSALAPLGRRLSESGVEHVHVHFAATACLQIMRLSRILGFSYSVTAHGYDIYEHRANLTEKLGGADFAIATCEYTARELRTHLPADHADNVRTVIMGVDPTVFRRTTPYPGGRTVLGVGRLVEKKGFAYLLEAAAILRDRGTPVSARVVGTGPLAGELKGRARELRMDGAFEIVQGWGPEAIRELLEDADVLAMPCVIAANGDRDSMPVVVKEAMAMEVPIVASAEVGLPEIVKDGWGRLCRPGDAASLANALEEVLSLPASERIELGRAGRRHVERACDLRAESRRVGEMLNESLRPA